MSNLYVYNAFSKQGYSKLQEAAGSEFSQSIKLKVIEEIFG